MAFLGILAALVLVVLIDVWIARPRRRADLNLDLRRRS
jgi:hypothetical protein